MTDSSAAPVRRRRSKGYSWLQHGSNRKAEFELVGWALVALAVGLTAQSVIADRLSSHLGSLGGFAANAALWVVLGLTVFLAYRTSKPKRLFSFSRNDLLIGIVMGLVLRFGVDALRWQSDGYLDWPTFADGAGNVPAWWWLDGVLASAVFAPVVEEYFFRALLLVALYTAIRRFTGSPLASAVAATLVSTALFLLAHLVAGSFTMDSQHGIALVAVSVVASALVFLTGRFWSALVLHVTFNGTWVLLALVGTVFSGAGGGIGLA